jgi:hypothetical protein
MIIECKKNHKIFFKKNLLILPLLSYGGEPELRKGWVYDN